MTTKAAFAPEEWTVVLEGPPTAGMIVITAAHGGTFRETIAMSKAYTEAHAEHGESELLDEIVSATVRQDWFSAQQSRIQARPLWHRPSCCRLASRWDERLS